MSSPFLLVIKERMKRYAKRTIDTYCYWIKAYINFNKKNILANAMILRLKAFYLF